MDFCWSLTFVLMLTLDVDVDSNADIDVDADCYARKIGICDDVTIAQI